MRKSILSGIILLVIGAFIGNAFQKYRTAEDSAPRYFDYFLSINNNIVTQLKDVDKQVTIEINKEKIENLGLVNIRLYNFSDRDFDAVPIRIEINSKKIISSNYYGYDGSRELVKEDSIKNNQDTSITKKYFILNLASRKKLTPIFSADFLIDGNINENDVKLFIDKIGLDKRDFNYDHFNNKSIWESDWFIAIVVIIGIALGGLILGMILLRISNMGQKKYEAKVSSFITEILKNKYKSDIISFSIEDFVKLYFKIRNYYYWKTTSKFGRFIEGLKKPEEI